MTHNPLITEIRKKRAEILESYEGDYHSMMTAMQQNQWTSGHEVMNLARDNRQAPVSAKSTRRKTAKLPAK